MAASPRDSPNAAPAAPRTIAPLYATGFVTAFGAHSIADGRAWGQSLSGRDACDHDRTGQCCATMNTGESAGDLLAEGAEALLEAAFRTGDYTVAETKLRQAQAVATNRATEADVADRLGWLLHFHALDHDRDTSRADDERALFQQALDIRRSIDDLGGQAAALFGLGLVHQVLRQDWATAIAHFREALALAEHADIITRSEIHRHVGFYYLVEDLQPDKAVEHLQVSLDLRHEHDDKRWLPSGTQALGWGVLAAGQQDDAVRLLREALDQARAIGLRASRVAGIEESLRKAQSGEIG